MNTYNVDKQVGDEVLRQLKLRPGQVIDGWGACPILREVFREGRGGAGKQSVPLPHKASPCHKGAVELANKASPCHLFFIVQVK